MKYFIVILAVAALAHANFVAKTPKEFRAAQIECLKEHPVSAETEKKILKFELDDEEGIRQHLLCTVKKIGIFDDHDGYNIENVITQFKANLDEAEVRSAVTACADKNPKGTSPDVVAYRGHKCLDSSPIGKKVHAYIKSELAKL